MKFSVGVVYTIPARLWFRCMFTTLSSCVSVFAYVMPLLAPFYSKIQTQSPTMKILIKNRCTPVTLQWIRGWSSRIMFWVRGKSSSILAEVIWVYSYVVWFCGTTCVYIWANWTKKTHTCKLTLLRTFSSYSGCQSKSQGWDIFCDIHCPLESRKSTLPRTRGPVWSHTTPLVYSFELWKTNGLKVNSLVSFIVTAARFLTRSILRQIWFKSRIYPHATTHRQMSLYPAKWTL